MENVKDQREATSMDEKTCKQIIELIDKKLNKAIYPVTMADEFAEGLRAGLLTARRMIESINAIQEEDSNQLKEE